MERAVGFADISSLYQIIQILKKDGPFDVIHGQSSKGGGYARLAGLITGVPVVYSPHAFITLSPLLGWRKRIAYSILERVLSLATARIFCCSQSEYFHARKLGIPAKRLVIVPNGLSVGPTPTRDELRQRYGFAQDDIIAGFVGRMEEQKAPDRFIEAAAKLFSEVPALKFVLIGDGPKRKPLQELLENIPGGERVHWLGNIDARPVFPMFDIFVMTSLYEGFPFALLEALWAGLPIVSTPVGGTEEMIELGFNGLIVPQGSRDRLVQAIKSLALNPSIRRELGAASLQKAEKFTFSRCCDLIEQFYGDAVARKEPVPYQIART
jgi:glycosyltransferase involved in cell wall biosynthesis